MIGDDCDDSYDGGGGDEDEDDEDDGDGEELWGWWRPRQWWCKKG